MSKISSGCTSTLRTGIYGPKRIAPGPNKFEKISDEFEPSSSQTEWPIDPWLETVFISANFELLVLTLPSAPSFRAIVEIVTKISLGPIVQLKSKKEAKIELTDSEGQWTVFRTFTKQ